MAARMGHMLVLAVGFCFLNIVHCKFLDVGVKYQITLDVFSGRQDPDWEIDENDKLYQQIAYAVNNGPPTELDDDLGYRGFVVKATNIFGQMAWKTVGRNTNDDLENALLTSCPYGLDKEVMGEVKSGITGIVGINEDGQIVGPNYVVYKPVHYLYNPNNGQNVLYLKRAKRQAPNVPGAPNVGTGFNRGRNVPADVCSVRFEPDVWNTGPNTKKNNCYNYATNRMTNTFAQPGRGSGRKFTNMVSNEVYDACVRDGLTRLTGPDAGKECLIALVIWPGEDFHFYRLDNNGFWSHKSGQTLARDTDDAGNRIADPRTAERGPYTVFSGWLGCGPNLNLR